MGCNLLVNLVLYSKGANMKNYFIDLVNKRQSCRDFNDKPIEKETVLEIAKTASLSPSACNSQPWKMYLVTDEVAVKGVKEAVQDQGHNLFTEKAKAFIAVSEVDARLKTFVRSRYRGDHFIKYDIGELVAYITLTAESMGVSTCILGWMDPQKLKTAVNMPEEETCSIVIALGYSDIEVREKKRKPLEEIIVEV